jgi:hypothetical protein
VPLNGLLWEKEWHYLAAVERTSVQKEVNDDDAGLYGVRAPSAGWLLNDQHVSMHQGTMYSPQQQRVRRRSSSGPTGSPSGVSKRVTRLSGGSCSGGQGGGHWRRRRQWCNGRLVLVFFFFFFFFVVVVLLIIPPPQ